MVDLPAFLSNFSNSVWVIFFWATIWKSERSGRGQLLPPGDPAKPCLLVSSLKSPHPGGRLLQTRYERLGRRSAACRPPAVTSCAARHPHFHRLTGPPIAPVLDEGTEVRKGGGRPSPPCAAEHTRLSQKRGCLSAHGACSSASPGAGPVLGVHGPVAGVRGGTGGRSQTQPSSPPSVDEDVLQRGQRGCASLRSGPLAWASPSSPGPCKPDLGPVSGRRDAVCGHWCLVIRG